MAVRPERRREFLGLSAKPEQRQIQSQTGGKQYCQGALRAAHKAGISGPGRVAKTQPVKGKGTEEEDPAQTRFLLLLRKARFERLGIQPQSDHLDLFRFKWRRYRRVRDSEKFSPVHTNGL